MKDSIVDVLMYLFDNYMTAPAESEREISLNELEEAGFPTEEINKAFTWLEDVAGKEFPEGLLPPASRATRVFTEEECLRFDIACRNFLLNLEQLGVIDTKTRELIIQCVMALDGQVLNLSQFKRIILIVLMNQPEQEKAASWIEDLLYEEDVCSVH